MLKTPGLDTAKFGPKRRNLDFQSGRGGGQGLLCSGEICGGILRRIFVFVLRVFHPQNLPLTLHRKFDCGFAQKNLVCHGLLRERFEEVNPENSTRLRDRMRARGREDAEFTGSGVGASARSVSGTSAKSSWQLHWVSRHTF